MQYRPSKHDCREHIVRRTGPNGKARYHCSVCTLAVTMRFGPRDVLMRVPAKAVQ